MRAAVVGLGFGRHHAATLRRLDGVELVALAQAHEPDPPLSAFADRLGVRVYRDPLELLARERLDLVCICNRPSARRPLVEAAVERGVALLVEKPLAGTLEDCERVAAAVERSGAWAAVNFEMRWLPPLRRLAGLLADGVLGAPVALTISYVMDPAPAGSWSWRREEGGSPLWENACHAFDLVRHLLGEPARVHASAANRLGPGAPAPDAAVVTIELASGALASVTCGAFGTEERRVPMRLDLHGTRGHATVTGSDHTFDRIEWAARGGAPVVEDHPELRGAAEPGPFAEHPLLAPGLERVVAALRAGDPPPATVADGLAAARIAAVACEAGRGVLPVVQGR